MYTSEGGKGSPAMTSLSPLHSLTDRPVTLGKLCVLIASIEHFSYTFIVEPCSLTALLNLCFCTT